MQPPIHPTTSTHPLLYSLSQHIALGAAAGVAVGGAAVDHRGRCTVTYTAAGALQPPCQQATCTHVLHLRGVALSCCWCRCC